MTETQINEVEDVDIATSVEPAPQTVDYGTKVKLLPRFKQEVITALSEFAYVETHELIKVIETNDELPINIVNEVIRRISTFPYRGVVNVMRVIENEQNAYFEVVANEQTNAQ